MQTLETMVKNASSNFHSKMLRQILAGCYWSSGGATNIWNGLAEGSALGFWPFEEKAWGKGNTGHAKEWHDVP